MFLKIVKYFLEKSMNSAEMPEQLKKFLEDKNNNNLPDILEDGNLEKHIKEIQIGDKKYKSWDEVPPEYKKSANLENLFSPKKESPPTLTPPPLQGNDPTKPVNNNGRLMLLIPIIIIVGVLIYYYGT